MNCYKHQSMEKLIKIKNLVKIKNSFTIINILHKLLLLLFIHKKANSVEYNVTLLQVSVGDQPKCNF